MSLGALDFGLIVDGAVIIVEAVSTIAIPKNIKKEKVSQSLWTTRFILAANDELFGANYHSYRLFGINFIRRY
jgi:Cu/Ag efflux pump CusA